MMKELAFAMMTLSSLNAQDILYGSSTTSHKKRSDYTLTEISLKENLGGKKWKGMYLNVNKETTLITLKNSPEENMFGFGKSYELKKNENDKVYISGVSTLLFNNPQSKYFDSMIEFKHESCIGALLGKLRFERCASHISNGPFGGTNIGADYHISKFNVRIKF